jgi:hypothetical protein
MENNSFWVQHSLQRPVNYSGFYSDAAFATEFAVQTRHIELLAFHNH